MPESVVYNCDCLEYMRTLPDNAFEIAIVDPPYGAGFTEGGGCKGWFTKYHQNADDTEHRNLRGRFDRYNDAEACSQSVQVERERERTNRGTTGSEVRGADLRGTKRHYMFGGRKKESTYQERMKAAKEASKKSSRGTLPQGKIISESFSASHAIRSFGAATISRFRRRAASSSGKS